MMSPEEAAGGPGFGGGAPPRSDVRAGDRPAGASWATGSAALGRSGAAATAHPLATQTAIGVLRAGGSAVDAAIAANAVLGFVEPVSCGIGGDCFAFVWDPAAGAVAAMASSGCSPEMLSLEEARRRAVLVDGRPVLPQLGAVTVSVPGAVAGWAALHERYGRLPWADLFSAAIAYADAGTPVPQVIGAYLERNVAAFLEPGAGVEETANLLRTYAPAGRAPRENEMFRNPDLARTYRTLAEGGARAFYDGPIAETIAAYSARIGGWLTRADLRRHAAEFIEPLRTTYRGIDVYAMAANTQGLATLQILNILEQFDLRAAGFQSSASLHLQIEAKRLAYEDRARYYGDPHATEVPVAWLASKAYARERARLVRPDAILVPARPGEAPSRGDTTYLCAADASGMMVSLIQSNFRGMGSGLVPDGLGFMLQNRGELFSLEPGHPNLYAPGKRPFQTIVPGFAARDGRPWLAFGVMGGDMQPQGQAQIIVDRVDYGLDVQAAGDSPRWHHQGSSQSMGEDPPGLGSRGLLRLESGVPHATREALAALGWPIGPSDGGFGRYACIESLFSTYAGKSDPFYAAAADMRADGVALAY